MSEDTLEIEQSNEATAEVKRAAVGAGLVQRRRIAPWTWLVIAVAAVGLIVSIWFLPGRRSRALTRQQPVSESETNSSFANLSPEQRAAIAVEVAQTHTLQSDVTAPGKSAFNGNRVTPVKVEFPKGTIAINALPWADVWVDGEKIGETPIGNLQLTIGTHDILFRHPDLGEQRHKAIISLAAPARLSVDLRKK